MCRELSYMQNLGVVHNLINCFETHHCVDCRQPLAPLHLASCLSELCLLRHQLPQQPQGAVQTMHHMAAQGRPLAMLQLQACAAADRTRQHVSLQTIA